MSVASRQNAGQPIFTGFTIKLSSGRSTIALSQNNVLPRVKTKTGQLACPAPAQKGGHRRLLPWTIDLIEDAAIVEVLGLRGLPAAEHLIHGE